MSILPFTKQQGFLILLICTLGNKTVQAPIKTVTKNFDPHGFSRDLHKLVDMIDRVENLGSLPLGQPGQTADSLLSGLDMSQLSDMAGTFMNLLGSSEK